MPIPDFTSIGDLPAGVHSASLAEVVARFGVGSPKRRLVSLRLERAYVLAAATKHLARFVVFGSFVTDAVNPNDVDVFMIMDDDFDSSLLVGEALLLFDRVAA